MLSVIMLNVIEPFKPPLQYINCSGILLSCIMFSHYSECDFAKCL